jgi:hypothetical protein
MWVDSIDQLDKADPPPIPETYVFLLALQCLTAIANSFYLNAMPLINEEVTKSCAADNSLSPSAPRPIQVESLAKDSPLRSAQAMTSAIWPPLLFSLSFFISTSLSEALFHSVLASTKSFTIICGLLDLSTPRDAFLSSLCKFAIPPLVVATISANELSGLKPNQQQGLLSTGADALGLSAKPVQTAGLSPRNLSCLNSLISVADQLAGVLKDNWFNILEALQNAEFVLRLSAGAKKKQEESDSRANIARLFESTSTAMDDMAFSSFLKALAKLSSEMVGLPAQVLKEGDTSKMPELRRRAQHPTERDVFWHWQDGRRLLSQHSQTHLSRRRDRLEHRHNALAYDAALASCSSNPSSSSGPNSGRHPRQGCQHRHGCRSRHAIDSSNEATGSARSSSF